MFGLTPDIIRNIKEAFSKFSQIEKVILYGSRAKGNFKDGSDIDITLLGENLNLKTVYALETAIDELYLPYTFDISIFAQIDNDDLIEHILSVGQVFYVKKNVTLPKGWEKRKLGECFKLKSGDGLTSKMMNKNGTYPVFGGNGIAGLHDNFNLKGNNIIVGRVGALCGNARHITENIWLTDNAFKVVDFKYNFDYSFLTYLLHFKNLRGYARQAAQPVISNSSLKEVSLEFPKLLSEQKRIVTILDKAFVAMAKAKANAEQNLKNAKELFESFLQGVFENKGVGWVEKTLGEIAFVKSGGTPSRAKKEYWEGDIAWYSSGEINEMFTKKPERHINELAINNSSAKLFPKGSLLIGMYDTAALKMSIIDRYATFNQAIAGVEPNNQIDLVFILHSINSIKPKILNLRRGVRQKNLNLTKIKNIPIFLPHISEQQAIVKKLDALSVETKKLEAIYQQKIEELEELKKSVLQKAFNGELT